MNKRRKEETQKVRKDGRTDDRVLELLVMAFGCRVVRFHHLKECGQGRKEEQKEGDTGNNEGMEKCGEERKEGRDMLKEGRKEGTC
jgi:hypothetical protein